MMVLKNKRSIRKFQEPNKWKKSGVGDGNAGEYEVDE